MTVTADYSEYVEKRVILTHNSKNSDEAVETEGSVELANELGILIKPKGKTMPIIVELGDVVAIELAPEASKKLKAKSILSLQLGQARSHLLERHGVTLAEVNNLTEEDAFSMHGTIDHVDADLGHVHDKVAKSEKDEKAGESDSDSTE